MGRAQGHAHALMLLVPAACGRSVTKSGYTIPFERDLSIDAVPVLMLSPLAAVALGGNGTSLRLGSNTEGSPSDEMTSHLSCIVDEVDGREGRGGGGGGGVWRGTWEVGAPEGIPCGCRWASYVSRCKKHT